MMKKESFGIVPLVHRQDGWYVFLVQHAKAGHWGFPKGHPEPKEAPLESAIRELKEETSLVFIRLLHDQPLVEEYRFKEQEKEIFKTVSYFIAEVEGTPVLQKEEIADGMWLPFEKAVTKVTFPEGKSVLMKTRQILDRLHD